MFENPKKLKKRKEIIKTRKAKKIVSLHANICDTPIDQRSSRPPEERVLNCHRQTDRHTDRQTDTQTDRRTCQLYDRIGPVKMANLKSVVIPSLEREESTLFGDPMGPILFNIIELKPFRKVSADTNLKTF